MSPVLMAPAEDMVLQPTQEVLTEQSLRIVWHSLDEPGTPIVHLDLSGIRFPTAEGLGTLVALNRELRIRGGGLVLINVPTAIYEVLSLTRLLDVLDVRAE